MMHSDALLARAREGDKNAQGKLVQLWCKRIYNFAYKFFFDHDLAMEAAQKTFISMHRNIEGLQEVTRFGSWVYNIAVNYCREEVRKKKANRSVSLYDLRPGESEESYRLEDSSNRGENTEKQLRQIELSDRAAEVLVDGDQHWLIRERESAVDLFAGEHLVTA